MKNQKNQKLSLWLTMIAIVAVLFSACCKDYDKAELIQKDISITQNIKGVIIEGPWEVTITQDNENNSAWVEYNVPDNKITVEQRPNGYLFIKVHHLNHYRNVKLRANLKAELLETIDASGAAGINIFGEFNSDTEIDLSGASHLDGYWCEGKNTEITLSGASKIKNFSFFGEYMKVELSGASQMDVKNSEFNRCKVNASGASKFNAKGYAAETEFTGSGASYFYTFDLESDNLYIDLSGASYGEVTVNNSIKGTLSGASTLKYKRAENVNVDVTGASTLKKVD